ncbi:MAG: LamG-like jellyroll fold domain-containing protein, partial [Planctomycetota bacterium]
MKLKHFIIICSLVLLLPDPSFTQGKNNDLTAWWQFEVIEEDGVIESVSQVKSELIGFQKLIDGAQGKGLLFDGYTTYVASTQDSDVRITGGFTIEAWISFQAYPWNWVAIVDKQKDDTAGYNLSVDANGFLRFQVAVDGQLRTVKSSQRMELLKWYHLA